MGTQRGHGSKTGGHQDFKKGRKRDVPQKRGRKGDI